MSPIAGGGCVVSFKEYICVHGAQINFGDLTSYLTYGLPSWQSVRGCVRGGRAASSLQSDEIDFKSSWLHFFRILILGILFTRKKWKNLFETCLPNAFCKISYVYDKFIDTIYHENRKNWKCTNSKKK